MFVYVRLLFRWTFGSREVVTGIDDRKYVPIGYPQLPEAMFRSHR